VKRNDKKESLKKGFPSFKIRVTGNMVPKELLGNEEEGKEIPFLGSQKKGNQKRERAT
jgi:hypothetical protein